MLAAFCFASYSDAWRADKSPKHFSSREGTSIILIWNAYTMLLSHMREIAFIESKSTSTECCKEELKVEPGRVLELQMTIFPKGTSSGRARKTPTRSHEKSIWLRAHTLTTGGNNFSRSIRARYWCERQTRKTEKINRQTTTSATMFYGRNWFLCDPLSSLRQRLYDWSGERDILSVIMSERIVCFKSLLGDNSQRFSIREWEVHISMVHLHI